MVARINTVAFHGVDVQNVDGQVQISSGMPACTVAGYKRSILIFMMLSIFILPSLAIASGDSVEKAKECPLVGAEYIPHPSYKHNKDLDFILRLLGPEPNGSATIRTMFLLFEAYDKKGEKVSSMRFGDAWSNGGISMQHFSTYYGQYNDQATWQDFRPYADFLPIGVEEDFSQAGIGDVPYMLIFPATASELWYQAKGSPEHWNHYIKFYTEEKIFPDFSGYDFWVRRKCGEPEEEPE